MRKFLNPLACVTSALFRDVEGLLPRAFDAPYQQLERRTGELQDLWDSVKDKDRVNTGTAKGYMLYPHKGSQAAVYAPTAFYWCTLVVIVNVHGVIIGHFAQEATGSGACTTMTDPSAVKKLISTLIEAEDDPDIENYDGTEAWIVYSAYVPTSAPGYEAIMDNLKENINVQESNIKSISYRKGGEGILTN